MSAKGHASNFSARVTIPWESASVFLGPRRRRASRILTLIVFLRFINVMGYSYRSENSCFRAAIKNLANKTRDSPVGTPAGDPRSVPATPVPSTKPPRVIFNISDSEMIVNFDIIVYQVISAWHSLTANERNTRTLHALSPLSLDLVDSLSSFEPVVVSSSSSSSSDKVVW